MSLLGRHPFEPATVCDLCLKGRDDPVHVEAPPVAFILTLEKDCFVYHDDDGVHLRIKKTHTKRSLELLQLFLNNFIAQKL